MQTTKEKLGLESELADTLDELRRTKSALDKVRHNECSGRRETPWQAQRENESLVGIMKWYNLVDRKEYGNSDSFGVELLDDPL